MSAMRLVARLDTHTVSSPPRAACSWVSRTVQGASNRVPRHLPSSHTLALSRTSPRSSSQASAVSVTGAREMRYSAVPAKASYGRPNQVQELSVPTVRLAGRVGPPSVKRIRQSPRTGWPSRLRS